MGLGPSEYGAHTGIPVFIWSASCSCQDVKQDIMGLDSPGVQTVIDVCGPSEQKISSKESTLTKTKILVKHL